MDGVHQPSVPAPAPAQNLHQGPPVRSGPYEDVPVVLGQKRLPTGPDYHKTVINGKARKTRSSASAKPLRLKPYFQHGIREDEAARRERLAEEAAESEASDNEPARKRHSTRGRQTQGASSRSAISRPSSSTAPTALTFAAPPMGMNAPSGSAVPPAMGMNASSGTAAPPAMGMNALSGTAVPLAMGMNTLYGTAVPPAMGNVSYGTAVPPPVHAQSNTITVPLMPSVPSQQVPMHLLHPKMLPPALLDYLRELYRWEQNQVIDNEGALNLWAALDESRRIQVVELFGKSVAEAHRQATDVAFEATMPVKVKKAKTKRFGNNVHDEAPQPIRVTGPGGPLIRSESARQFVMQNAGQSLTSYPTMSAYSTSGAETTHTQSFVSATYSDSTLGLAQMEEVLPVGHLSNDSLDQGGEYVRRDKGKGRADVAMEFGDDADDEDDSMDKEEYGDVENTLMSVENIGASGYARTGSFETPIPNTFHLEASAAGPSNATPSASSEPSPPSPPSPPQESPFNAELLLVFMRKMDGVSRTLREHGTFIKELQEGNRAFQEAVLAELRAWRATSADTAAKSAPKPAAPRTAAAVLKVQTRSARMRGKEVQLTPEQTEEAHKIRQQGRMHAHIRSLLKISDSSEVAVRFPPLTDEQVAAYNNGDRTITCTPESLMVDFVQKWKTFGLNKIARTLIIRTFQKKSAGGAFAMNQPPDKMLTAEFLGALIDQYMKTLRRAHSLARNPKTKAQLEEFKRRCARNTRMGTLFQSRLFVVVHMGYGRHSILFSLMAASNMSGDETDGDEVTHPPVYRIIIAAWQSIDLRNFLWALDAKYIAHWQKPQNKRRTGGNPPRVRTLRDESRTIGGVAPVGLWRNCYDDKWLGTLDEYDLENLEIQEGNYDFSLHSTNSPATGV